MKNFTVTSTITRTIVQEATTTFSVQAENFGAAEEAAEAATATTAVFNAVSRVDISCINKIVNNGQVETETNSGFAAAIVEPRINADGLEYYPVQTERVCS